ncbi:MAG: ADP-ribosyltransferase [Magnetococcus sp. DMHC-1]
MAFRKLLGNARVNLLAQDARQAAEKSGVSIARLAVVDLASLRNYTGLTPSADKRNYQMINEALRSGNEAELARLAPLIETLKSALAKLPDYVGDVVRATDLPEGVAEGIVPGGIYSDAGFMSTAIGETSFEGKYMFFVKSKTGKWIEPFSFYPEQKDVLYPPGVEFEIMRVKVEQEDRVNVWLEEM